MNAAFQLSLPWIIREAVPIAFINPEQLHRLFSSFWYRANKERFPL
jgi:hypothetical protein